MATPAAGKSSSAARNPRDEGLLDKILEMGSRFTRVYGELPAAFLPWETSLIGTVVGLICAQNTRNEWSSIMYSNLTCLFPGDDNEPDWEKIR